MVTSAAAEDRRYCANLTYPDADGHISLSDSRSVAVERLAQLVGSGLGRRVRIALVAGIRAARGAPAGGSAGVAGAHKFTDELMMMSAIIEPFLSSRRPFRPV